MANERKEPTLSSSSLNDPRKAQEKKPVARSDRRVNTTAKTAPRPKPSRPVQQTVVTKSNSGMVFFVLLVALIALGGAAYSVWQLQQAHSTIVNQQERIAELEKKLTVSDDASSQSITSLAANFLALNDDVKLSLTEIDKLWATRNVNKKAISDNAEKLTTIDEQLSSTRNDLSNTDKAITGLQTTTKQLDEDAKTLDGKLADVIEKTAAQTATLSTVSEKIAALETGNTELERLAQNLKTQTSQQEITLQSLRERVAASASNANAQVSAATAAQINQLTAQVRDNQDAIRAIDAFRITVNRELLLLKQRAPAAQ